MWELTRQIIILVIGICTQLMPRGCFENIKNDNCAWILHVILKMKHQACGYFFFFGLVLTSDLSKPLGYILTVEMMHWSNLNPESTETKIAHPFAKKI